jgi:anti-anti-sigma regulatory factor
MSGFSEPVERLSSSQTCERACGARWRLVIDLRQMTFIDVIGARLLLQLTQDAGDHGWRLSLIHGAGEVHRMVQLVEALSHPPFLPDRREQRDG